MMEGMTAVKVAARVRPLVKREKNEGARICMTARPTDNAIDINNSTTFTFDMVFGVDSTQEEVYEAAAAPLLDKLFHGYNATIFAYGQTGSGKTHSMGTEDFHTDTLVSVSEQGIIPRVAAAIFARARQLPSANVAVSVSMLEIYEEKVHDLLGAGANLAIREAGGQVFVQDLREVQVHSPQDTMRQLEEGSNGRSKGATAMNARSSRSHAVFTISLAIAHNDDCDEAGANLRSKLHLVDLAGSERLKKTQATGERRKEGIKINEGLTVLGNVINALVENSKHVPYRNSKLTRILQDSLGGNSFTLMLVCVSPADSNSFESMNSLRYADRAKQIKNKPTVNVDPAAAELKRLRDANRELREQINRMRQKEFKAEAEHARYKNNAEQKMLCYQRRYEESKALSKRLQDQLKRQHVTQRRPNSNAELNGRQIRTFLEQELELFSTVEEARQDIEAQTEQRRALVSDRTRLQKEIRRLQRALDAPHSSAKRRRSDDGVLETDEQKLRLEDLRSRHQDVEKQIGLRDLEIESLNTKMAQVDTDANDAGRWEAVQTLPYALGCLRELFQMALTARTDQLAGSVAQRELADSLHDSQKEMAELKRTLEEQRAKTEADMRTAESQATRQELRHHRSLQELIAGTGLAPESLKALLDEYSGRLAQLEARLERQERAKPI